MPDQKIPSVSMSRRRAWPGALMLLVLLLSVAPSASAQGGSVPLRTADTFAVLAGSTVTNTGPTLVKGNLGVNPGSAVTGFPPGQVSNGTIHAADTVAGQAQSDLTAAYNDAAGRASNATISADLGNTTLAPGVYTSGSSMGLTGDLTLNGQGNANAVFIFQVGSTLTVAGSSRVLLINGAQACNVFWQVGSSATVGTNSSFVGNILALDSISLLTGTQLQGRALARNAAVTLENNQVTKGTCASPPPPPPPPPPTVSATNTSATTCAGQPVTVVLHGSDPDGARLTYAITTSPSHGSLGPIYQAGGTVTYTPSGGYTGQDSFTYHVTSRNGTSNNATATITINPCDAAGGGGGSGSGGGAGGSGSGGTGSGPPTPGGSGPATPDSGAADTPLQVVPAHFVGHARYRVAYGRVVWAHGRRYFVIRVGSRSAPRARLRIRMSYRGGRVRHMTRTVRTNRRVKLRGLRLANVRSVRVTILG